MKEPLDNETYLHGIKLLAGTMWCIFIAYVVWTFPLWSTIK